MYLMLSLLVNATFSIVAIVIYIDVPEPFRELRHLCSLQFSLSVFTAMADRGASQ